LAVYSGVCWGLARDMRTEVMMRVYLMVRIAVGSSAVPMVPSL